MCIVFSRSSVYAMILCVIFIFRVFGAMYVEHIFGHCGDMGFYKIVL